MKPNWQTKKLGEVCDFYRGLTYSKKDEVDFSENIVLRSNNIDLETSSLNLNELRYINSKISIPDNKKVKKGSIIICTANGSKSHLGKIALIDKDYGYAFGGFMGQLIPSKEIISKYFFYILKSDLYKKHLAKISSGANINNLKFSDLSELEIPLPPLPEQHRIVKILDEVFADVAKAKENAEKNLQNAKELFESYLQSVFANPSSAKATAGRPGKDWEEKILNDVCEDIFAGGDKPKGAFSKFKTDEFQIPIFSNGIKNDGLYGYTNTARIKKPSITISARGTIGYSVIRREAFFPIIRLIVLTPHDDLIDLDFLHYSIKNNSIIGNGTSIPQLTVPAVKKIKVSFPKSLKIQKEIIKKLDELSHQTKKLEAIYRQKLADLEELKKSVLKKAFNGEF